MLKDVQSEIDVRGLAIDQVGVKGVRYPIVVLDKKNVKQHTVATINMYVNLPREFRGTHMSRFIEVLEAHRGEIAIGRIEAILIEMKSKLKAKDSFIEIEFPYFIEKKAPVTKAKSLMEYQCKFIGKHNSNIELLIELKIPVSTLCPCSKSISDRGAHNQRGIVKVTYESRELIWLEDIIHAVEGCASSELYTLLKRPDERYVTEYAYDHPTFVEDVVRNAATALSKFEGIDWFQVEAENFESIHNHNAYAMIYTHSSKKKDIAEPESTK